MAIRRITAAERKLAYSVFHDSIRYDNVYISDMIGGDQVITTAVRTPDLRYIILWARGFSDTMDTALKRATLIHEMTHVWQGNNGITGGFYMQQSIVAQVTNGVADIIRKRDFLNAIRNWDSHRSTAYAFNMADMGKPWSTFNVEQQASIVESWYVAERDRGRRSRGQPNGVYGGGASATDVRYAYIRDVIRARRPNASLRPVMLPYGADRQIKQLQDKLVSLGYLAARYADGTVGRRHSATLDAVALFQKRHGLKVDRQLGGPDSETRRLLAQPAHKLRRVP